MTKYRKIIIRAILVFVILIPIAAFAHFIIFPQETRTILIDYSNFKKQGRLYFNESTDHRRIDSLQSVIILASNRIADFWGQKISNPKVIFCGNQEDFTRYCVNPGAPAVTYFKLGSFVVLSADAADVDIIAHEFSHTELSERIGFYNFNYKIPSWYKHGLAMQNDYRDYYSEDTLKAKSNNFTNLPDINSLKSDEQFYSGTRAQIMLHYMIAKHVIRNWYTKEKLASFIKAINAGKTFEEAYGH